MVVYLMQALQSKNEIHIAQAKILIVLVFYIAVGLGTLSAYASFAREGPRFRDELERYFICEATGPREPCDRSRYNDYNIPVFEAVAYIVLGLIGIANLTYAMNYRKMREICKRWCGHEKSSSG